MDPFWPKNVYPLFGSKKWPKNVYPLFGPFLAHRPLKLTVLRNLRSAGSFSYIALFERYNLKKTPPIWRDTAAKRIERLVVVSG